MEAGARTVAAVVKLEESEGNGILRGAADKAIVRRRSGNTVTFWEIRGGVKMLRGSRKKRQKW